ncbi:MAG: NAD(P)/FAD-dependent oxidoreductase [Halobacteria archaeon]
MIGVIGGGFAGLAAAYKLQRYGIKTRVFEASEDLGGLAAVYRTRGDPVEKFYHHLSKTEETIVELAKNLGLENDIEWHIGKNGIYVDGEVYPMDTPWEILSFPYLSFYDKFRLGMLTVNTDVRGGIPSFDTYESLDDFEDVPVGKFVKEHTTENVYETFFEPLLDAKFGERKSDVSAAWLLGRIKFRGERDLLKGEVLGYLDGGFGRLLDELVEAVGRENIETGARVTDITMNGNGVSELEVKGVDGESSYEVDGVVVATMPNVLESLTGYSCEIDFQGTVCSVVSMEESLLDTYWLNILDKAPFGALIEHTNFVPPERYGGEHLLYVPRYVQSLEDEVWQMDDEEVRETWLKGIEKLFPKFDRSTVNWVKTARNPRTAPVYERGYLDMVVPYDLSNQVTDSIYYAGMATRAQYPERSLNGAIEAGFSCARIIKRKKKVH